MLVFIHLLELLSISFDHVFYSMFFIIDLISKLNFVNVCWLDLILIQPSTSVLKPMSVDAWSEIFSSFTTLKNFLVEFLNIKRIAVHRLFFRCLSNSNTNVPENLIKIKAHCLDLDPSIYNSTPLTFIHLPNNFSFMRNFYPCSTRNMSEEVEVGKLIVFNS